MYSSYVLPQISRNSQNRLAEDVLPQISQILTDGVCLEFCEFCVFCGTSYAPSESVKICAICGRIVLVAWGLPSYRIDWQRMFSHRIHGIHRIDWQRVSSHRIHGIHRIDWQRVFSHRIHGIHRTDWQRMFSHRFHRFSQMVCVWSSVNSVCSVGPPTLSVNL